MSDQQPPSDVVEITDEMIRAGKAVLLGMQGDVWPEFLVASVFTAMARARDNPGIVASYERIYRSTGQDAGGQPSES